MTDLNEIMDKLIAMGSEQTKQIFLRHGAKEPLFGVKVGDLKKLVKDVKKDQHLARALYETGNSDAMYLAGLTVNPKTATKEMLQDWVRRANWYMLAEYTVAWVAAESPYAMELAREWIKSPEEMIAVCGWSTYANYISITPDELLDINEIRQLLKQVEATVHDEMNRVRYTMNSFVIAVGTYAAVLHEEAMRVAESIGSVHVDVGATACKVPLASEYLRKAKQAGKIGKKKKTCIC
ncbi:MULTISPECIES: DNA alkylation repair protein [Paenibacillus]|nr:MULTISPECIES: DNA alkylation repair protein [Paenibacillus]NTZ20659.1 DNA alkylation repair protein [Paenibacillus sp. JMULE4]GCL74373.1 DNA alkylation repair protein [Paenibacillus naphthalenovorans]